MKHICIVNACAGYGGPERLIEDWVAHIDKTNFSIDYIYTPYPGHETHAQTMTPHCQKIIPLPQLIPLFFPRNIQPTSKTNNPTETATPQKPSIKARIWKTLVPASLNETVWYRRVTNKAATIFATSFKEQQPDLLHLNMAVNNWISSAILGAQQTCPQTPLLLHTHNPPVFHKPTPSDLTTLQKINHYTYVSQATAKQWEHLIKDKTKTSIIHNAVDTTQFHQTKRPCETTPNQPIHFGCCTRLSPMKAVDILLQAAGILKQQNIPFQLTIAGTGPDQQKLKEQAKRLNLTSKTTFLGHRNDIQNILSQLDIYIQTSRSTEGLPIALLESMATGLPSIVTDIGGTTEAILPNKTGYIIPKENPNALADCMKKYIQNPTTIPTMGHAARQHAQKNFSMTRMVNEIQNHYTQLINTP